MRPIEEEIIALINLYKDDESNEIDILFELNKLSKEPLGKVNSEFITHPVLIKFRNKNSEVKEKIPFPILWIRLEDYLATKDNPQVSKEKLDHVEEALKTCLYNITPETKMRGTDILPGTLANEEFIRKIYSLNDEHLNKIFLKYLPIPRAKVFAGHSIPKKIADREQESTKTVINILERAKKKGIKTSDLESDIIRVQRKFRTNKRKKEDLQRVSFRHNLSTEETKKLLEDANTPYTPQCDQALSKRIMAAAEKIELFSTVSHLTTASALRSIFDEGLYGRRTILQFYLPFKPSALWEFDIQEGDANVVCLGANEIDSGAAQGIKLEFDANKISEDNPCVFFKQRDLGFTREKIREIKIGNVEFGFSHTEHRSGADDKLCPFKIFRKTENGKFDPNSTIAETKIKNTLLIAYDIKKMHQILTLNFFRFIDSLDNNEIKEKIYSALNNLNDETLINTLTEIGMKITDTMEFNFYGAYKIDFSALINITSGNHTIHLPTLINELNNGIVEELQTAIIQIPEIFKSYRFIDYLITNTKNEKIISALTDQRDKLVQPLWKA